MNGSGIFRLGWADLVRGLVLAILTAVLTSCQQAISEGSLDPTAWNWKAIGGVALAAVVAYLLKNLVSDADGKVLGKIGAVALVLLAAGATSGCSSMLAGLSIGGAGGVAGPGAAAVKVVHGDPRNCPDVASQGSIPATGVVLSCTVRADGSRTESATLGTLDSSAILGAAMKAQAEQGAAALAAIQQLAPLAAQAAATAAAGPVAGAAAAALLKPPAKPPAVTVDTSAIPTTP